MHFLILLIHGLGIWFFVWNWISDTWNHAVFTMIVFFFFVTVCQRLGYNVVAVQPSNWTIKTLNDAFWFSEMRFHQNTYGGQLAPLKFWNVVFLISDTWFFIRKQMIVETLRCRIAAFRHPKNQVRKGHSSCYRWTAAQWAATCKNAGYIRGTAAQWAANWNFHVGPDPFFLSSPLCTPPSHGTGSNLKRGMKKRKEERGSNRAWTPAAHWAATCRHAYAFFLHTDNKCQQELQSTRGSLSRLRSKDRKWSHLHFVHAPSCLGKFW